MHASKTDYAAAGVDTARAARLLARIKGAVNDTARAGVMGGIGGFGGLFDLAATGYADPVLVAGADGVGTKIRLAIDHARHESIGIDLVAMCANDVAVSGAEPLFFLDYFACSALDVGVAEEVISGMADGCRQAGCTLLGGETAEMPGMYPAGDYDLAGFCVGAVERGAIITGETVCEHDLIIGLPSNGAHANGYSLIRKIIDDNHIDIQMMLAGRRLLELLLQPTVIYARAILALHKAITLRAVAHITGGGISGNLPRVLPDALCAHIDTRSWQWPPLFSWLQRRGDIATAEMYRTFNCGMGMTLVLAPDDLSKAKAMLAECGIEAVAIGRIARREGDEQVSYR